MTFPLDVIQIGNKIVLIQGEITPEFITKLDTVNRQMLSDEIPAIEFRDQFDDLVEYEIRASRYSNNNYLETADIVLDRRKTKTRQFKFVHYELDLEEYPDDIAMLSRMKATIKHYKQLMGYL